MSIKLRFAFTLGFLLMGFAVVFAVLRSMEKRAITQERERFSDEQAGLLDHWLQVDAGTLAREARSLAADTALTRRLVDAQDGTTRLAPSPSSASSGLTVWLLRDDGRIIARAGEPGFALPESLPLTDAAFRRRALQAGGSHFFFRDGTSLNEVWVEPTSAREAGWLFLVRRWDRSVLQQLAALMGARLRLGAASAPERSGYLYLKHPLPDWRGQPAEVLVAEIPALNARQLLEDRASPAPWFILFGLMVMLGLGVGLRRWVLNPLGQISTSLASGDTTLLQSLREEQNELGGVARLVESSFAQRDALRRSEASLQEALQERIRLGRDLHDSVIQSLYATGMGLAGIKARLRADQADVLTGLEQSRAALNETILDLRNFITGLEPEALKEQTFGQAVFTLLKSAQSVRPIETSSTIDEALAARLTLSQRVNILLMAREALSNALRHGGATEIAVSLRAADSTAEFEISDNGCGFDPAFRHGGHGLENLAGRARDIGADLTVDSAPGQGARLRLTFKLPPPDPP